MEQLLEQLLSSFNVNLLFSLTFLTYITLKVLDNFINKTHNLIKHSVASILCLVLCFVYFKYLNLTVKEIIPTYLLSTAFYDVILKKVLDKLNIAYKK